MQRLPKEAFVAALPVLQQRLQENYPNTPVRVLISNNTASPQNPFAPKLSSVYGLSVVVFVDGVRHQFVPFVRPSSLPGVIGYLPANKSLSAVVAEWVQNLDTKKVMVCAKERISPFKEELMMEMWRPERVERWIALGGLEILETL